MKKFIAIEGGDGSGKGTQTRLLVKHLKQLGKNVLELDFPQYGQDSTLYVERYLNGVYGEADDVPADLASLAFALDRLDAKQRVLDHLIKPDSVVVSNRYVASNLAHQGTRFEDKQSRQKFYNEIMRLEYVLLGIAKPDITIVLLVPSDVAQSNVDKKEARQYTERKRDIHEASASHLDRTKANYEELCELYPDEFIPIQCTDPPDTMRSVNDIQEEIQDITSRSL